MTYLSNNFHPAVQGIFPDPVDLSVLVSYEGIQVAGEPDLIVEFIDLYLEDVPRRIDALRDAFTQRSWKTLAAEAHRLRGSSGSLGALQVAEICLEIESMKPSEGWSDVPSLLSWLELECERALHIFTEERRARMR